jgi:hypothetical protein
MVCCSDASHRNLVAYSGILGAAQLVTGLMFIILYAAFDDSVFIAELPLCAVYAVSGRSAVWLVHGMVAAGFAQLNLLSLVPSLRRNSCYQTLMIVVNSIGFVGFGWVAIFAGILAGASNVSSACTSAGTSLAESIGLKVVNVCPFVLIATILASVSVLFSASVAHGNKLQAAAVTQEGSGIHGLQQFQYNQQPQVQFVQPQAQPSVGVRVNTNF